jgi:hypothetical protein
MQPVGESESQQSFFTAYFQALVEANISTPELAVMPVTQGKYRESELPDVLTELETGNLGELYLKYIGGGAVDAESQFQDLQVFIDGIRLDLWHIASARTYYGTETAYAAYNQVKAALEAPNPFPTLG